MSPVRRNYSDGEDLKNYRIAVIEGDGIGREVVPEGIQVLQAAGSRFDLSFSWEHFDWGCQTYLETGRMMQQTASNNGVPSMRSTSGPSAIQACLTTSRYGGC